jgi:Ser/Thr protein kinase RdoA (MazF antagonist)
MSETPYDTLSPDAILEAIESRGYPCDGHLLALNSYENRVYQVGLEDGTKLIAKFYRPGRFTDAAILEEHAFVRELEEEELPCVAPIADAEGATLHAFAEHRFALFPRKGGHAPDLERGDDLEVLGRTLARIHQVGARARFVHRPTLSVERLGIESRTLVLDGGFVPAELRDAYASTTAHLLDRLTRMRIEPRQRIHGDCHPGNILWRDDAPHFVDFDDCTMGPGIQDLWMLLAGEREERTRALRKLLAGYETFLEFDDAELALIEPLRTLRIMHHAAWIARRWHDPAFPRAFPAFTSVRYWSDHVLHLREQQAALDEPPLAP